MGWWLCLWTIKFIGSVNQLDDLRMKVNEDMNSICNYFKDNLLVLNNDKTKMIALSSGRKVSQLYSFTFDIEGHTVATSKPLKCLGLILDRSLTWKDHIENTAKICFMRIRTLYAIRESFTASQLQTLCQSFIMSIINYMLTVVGSTNVKYLCLYN